MRPDTAGRDARFVAILLARMAAVPAVVLLPLVGYLASVLDPMFEPWWAEAAPAGWSTCLTTTGEAWLPAVLWASAAMYAAAGMGRLDAAWIRLGLLLGCLASGFLTVAAWERGRAGDGGSALEYTALPAATLLAHGIALALALRARRLPLRTILGTAVAGGALAAANIGAAIGRFDRLPYQTPPLSCWIVTAATCGHAWVVRPLRVEWRRGVPVRVNRQLLAFRAFEAAWRAASPRTHAVVRRLYGVVGPRLARRLTSPWAADATYVLLKPLEWIARVGVAIAGPSE